MIKHFVIFGIFLVVATILGLTFYLQVNDLAGCDDRPSVGVNCQKADAIVAVSGGDTDARTNQAISLYKKGWAGKLIFSGAAEDKTGPSNAAVMRKIAITAGVPASSVLIDERSETTKQNAENSKLIFDENNMKSVILVTSGYHQRRASLEFKKVAGGVNILNSPVKSDKSWSFLWWLTPVGWFLSISEATKVVIFYTAGAV